MFKLWLILICAIGGSTIIAIGIASQFSSRKQQITDRFKGDLKLLRKHALRIFLSSLVIGYIQSIFGRNLAFLWHHPLADYVVDPSANLKQHRLHDRGFDLIPDMSDSETLLSANEFLQYCMAATIIATCLMPYVSELHRAFFGGVQAPGIQKVFTINVVTRLLQGIAIGHMLRMPSFLATSIPGPSPHCIGAVEKSNHPQSFGEVFYAQHMGANCGDLIFSGHVLFALTAVGTVLYYVGIAYGRRAGYIVGGLMMPIFAMQLLAILGSRAHYTVDLVTSMIITSLLWVVETHLVWKGEWMPQGEIVATFWDEIIGTPLGPSPAESESNTPKASAAYTKDVQPLVSPRSPSATRRAAEANTDGTAAFIVAGTPVNDAIMRTDGAAVLRRPMPVRASSAEIPHSTPAMAAETPRRPWSVVDGDLPPPAGTPARSVSQRSLVVTERSRSRPSSRVNTATREPPIPESHASAALRGHPSKHYPEATLVTVEGLLNGCDSLPTTPQTRAAVESPQRNARFDTDASEPDIPVASGM